MSTMNPTFLILALAPGMPCAMGIYTDCLLILVMGDCGVYKFLACRPYREAVDQWDGRL